MTNLGRKYIGAAEGRSELIKLLVSEFIAAKPVILKNNMITPLSFLIRKLKFLDYSTCHHYKFNSFTRHNTAVLLLEHSNHICFVY